MHLLTSENDSDVIAQKLSKTLRGLKTVMDQSLELAAGIEKRVEAFVALVSELVECCVASNSMTEREKEQAEAAMNEATAGIQKAEREKKRMVEDMERYERWRYPHVVNFRAFPSFPLPDLIDSLA